MAVNEDIEIRFVVTTPEQYTRDESSLIFTVGVNDDVTYCEFLDTAEKIFDIVTEIEKENQYNKLNDTLNSLLKYQEVDKMMGPIAVVVLLALGLLVNVIYG